MKLSKPLPFIAFACNVGFLLVFFCSSAVVTASFTEEDLIANPGPLGRIIGVNSTTSSSSPSSSRPYISFLGIRYAAAPTAEKRFLPSKRADDKLNATGDFIADTVGLACIQPSLVLPISLSEDCLTVNIYTPKPYKGNDSDLLPVIFFIHGGAFTAGQGGVYSGNRLLNRDVVLVNFNYRLGVLGFFSLDSESAPGNAGLYDIVTALDWTRTYIKFFGGNPNKITIAGQSAGSVAVTHLMASPLAKGMFHGAIASSGSALAAWGTTADPLKGSLKIAELSNCYDPAAGGTINKTIIIDCMQKAEPTALVNALYTFQVEERRNGRLGFDAVSPSLQTFPASSSFKKILGEHPRYVFEAGRQADVPLLMGTTRHDGSYVLGVYYNRYLKANNYVNETGSDLDFMKMEAVPAILQALGIPNEYGVYDSIAKMYLGNSRKSGKFWEMYPGFIDLFSVFFFKASSYQTALYHSNLSSQTFWYNFDYQGRNSLFNILFYGEIPPFSSGITHSDDLIYVFDIPLTFFNTEDYEVSARMVDYWANFATFGTPTPNEAVGSTWPKLTEQEANFVSIGKESLEVLQHFDDHWSDIGWELLPATETPPPLSSTTPESISTTTPSISTSTPISSSSTPPAEDSSTRGNAGMFISSCKYLIVVLLSVNCLN